MDSMKQIFKNPLKQVRFCRNSAIIGIAPEHVRRLGITPASFFEEVPIDGGLILRMHRLSSVAINENESQSRCERAENGGGEVESTPKSKAELPPILAATK
jgi:hypothetical protein